MTEDQFLEMSSKLGVDRVRYAESSGSGTVYVYVRFDRTEDRLAIVNMAKQVWPARPIVLLVTVPSNPPQGTAAGERH